jgi:hypothetical protein
MQLTSKLRLTNKLKYFLFYCFTHVLCIKLKITALNILWMYTGRGVSFVCRHLRRFLQSVRYATILCVTCSQTEKLKAALLDITQTHVVIPEHNWREQVYQQVGEGKLGPPWSSRAKCRNNWTPAFIITRIWKGTLKILCGMFLLLLAAFCFIAVSAVTVK